MKIWYALRWAYLALLAELRKLCDMILHTTFYLTAEPERIWIGVNPETVSLDANNIQSTPLDIRIWTGEGSNKSEYKAYVTLRVESVVNEHATVLYEENLESKIFSWGYTIPEDKYPTANRISIYAYDDEIRTKEIAAKQVNIVAANPTPFPRPEEWAAGLVYKNGEYLIFGDMVYMWCSRVPGNTDVDPKTWMQNNPNSGLWKSYTEYAVLATKVFMAKFGLMGQAVFKDEYMISQQGIDSEGNETWDYRKFGTKDFTPNLELNFRSGRIYGTTSELTGSIKRGIVYFESGSLFQVTPKSNIYVVKNNNAQNRVVLFFSSGTKSYGTESCIVNGGKGTTLISYVTGSLFLFKGKQYGVIKLSKPGDMVELIFSSVVSDLSAETSGIAFIIKNKSDFKESADGITLESI